MLFPRVIAERHNMIRIKNETYLDYINPDSKANIIKYSLGGLMYTPAHNDRVSAFLAEKRYSHLRSLALCLEDAIADGSEKEAVNQIKKTFSEIEKAVSEGIVSEDELPYIFIRVKTPEQIDEVYDQIRYSKHFSGFILPKFDLENAEKYLTHISKINECADNNVYAMPILESHSVSDIRNRTNNLAEIKCITDTFYDCILNIRIGGNDFCSRFGVRRKISDTIYDIAVISSIISDIVNIFNEDYVISAPVWDYFSGTNPEDTGWKDGLRREMEKDILNGLTGKTAIHPSQLEIINSELAVTKEDFSDAVSILNWNDNLLAVSKSISGSRMNEKKVHGNWAEKIAIRAAVYGIKDIERKPETID